jgi:hypothetical protein
MADGAMTIAVKTNLSRNDGQGRRLAFRAIHGAPLEKKHQETQIYNLRRIKFNLFIEGYSTANIKRRKNRP